MTVTLKNARLSMTPPAETLAIPPGSSDELVFASDKKITLSCGKSSITLYPNGKIVLKGDYILSDAEGVNRLTGGRIDIN